MLLILDKKYKQLNLQVLQSIRKIKLMKQNNQEVLNQSIKQFFKFVSNTPQFQNAIFLFSLTDIVNPKQFFDNYQAKQIKIMQDGTYLTYAQLQDQKLKSKQYMFNINYEFTSQKKNQNARQKTLSLLYLLKKTKICKILICIDDESIERVNSQELIKSLNLIYDYFCIKQHKKIKQSIGFLISCDQNDLTESKRSKLLKMLFQPLQEQGQKLFKNNTNINEMIQLVKCLNKQKSFINNHFDFQNNKQKVKISFTKYLERLKWFQPQKNVNMRLLHQFKAQFKNLQYLNNQQGFGNFYLHLNNYFQTSINFKIIQKSAPQKKYKQLPNEGDKYKCKKIIKQQQFPGIKFEELQNQKNNWVKYSEILIFFINLYISNQQYQNQKPQIKNQYFFESFKRFIVFLFKLGFLNDFKVLENLLMYKDIHDTLQLSRQQEQIIGNYKMSPIAIHFEGLCQQSKSYIKFMFLSIKKLLHHLDLLNSRLEKNYVSNFSYQINTFQKILSYVQVKQFKDMQDHFLIPTRFIDKIKKSLQILINKKIQSIQDPNLKIQEILACKHFQKYQQKLVQLMGDSLNSLYNQNTDQSVQNASLYAKQAIECYHICNTSTSIAKTIKIYQKHICLDRIILFKDQAHYQANKQLIKNYLQFLRSIGSIQKARQICYSLISLDENAFKNILNTCTQIVSSKKYLQMMKRLNEFNVKNKDIDQLKSRIKQLIK